MDNSLVKKQKGNVSLLLVLLFSATGLMLLDLVDTGHLITSKQKSQNAADSLVYDHSQLISEGLNLQAYVNRLSIRSAPHNPDLYTEAQWIDTDHYSDDLPNQNESFKKLITEITKNGIRHLPESFARKNPDETHIKLLITDNEISNKENLSFLKTGFRINSSENLQQWINNTNNNHREGEFAKGVSIITLVRKHSAKGHSIDSLAKATPRFLPGKAPIPGGNHNMLYHSLFNPYWEARLNAISQQEKASLYTLIYGD